MDTVCNPFRLHPLNLIHRYRCALRLAIVDSAADVKDTVSMLQHPVENVFEIPQTVQESVGNLLRSMIVSRRLKPGERLVQGDLAERLGVSRTPVREALHKLASEGLVTILPHKGAAVSNFSLGQLKEIYSVRIALEGYGAHLAALSITQSEIQQLEQLVIRMKEVFGLDDRMQMLEVNREFYSVLFAATRQQRLYEMIMTHLDLAALYRQLAFTVDSHYANTIGYHEEFLDSLRKGDAERAEKLARVGLEETVADLIGILSEQDSPDARSGNWKGEPKGR